VIEHRVFGLTGSGRPSDIEVGHFWGCKGREYDAVVIHLDGRDVFKKKELSREQRRVLYVAISRAKNFVYIHGVQTSMGALLDQLFD
jgi:superfamily I DNA/RNA helicase